jgi:hypothetical protein
VSPSKPKSNPSLTLTLDKVDQARENVDVSPESSFNGAQKMSKKVSVKVVASPRSAAASLSRKKSRENLLVDFKGDLKALFSLSLFIYAIILWKSR